MLRRHTRLILLAALGAALILTGGSRARVRAQTSEPGLTCSLGAIGLDTCLATLSNGIPPGDSITAALEAPEATMVGCESFASGSLCTVSGDSVTVVCPTGCPEGSEFEESFQVYAGESLAQQFTIAGPVAVPTAGTLEPQMFGSCLSGVLTVIGCIPSSAYLAYLSCMNAWMPACSFDLGYGYSGYYFPSTATYAFYVPVGNYYSFYSPGAANYYAFYSPTAQFFSYWDPADGYYVSEYPMAPAVSASTADIISQLYDAYVSAPYVSPAVAAFFLPSSAGGSAVVSAPDGARFYARLPFNATGGVTATAPSIPTAAAGSVASAAPPATTDPVPERHDDHGVIGETRASADVPAVPPTGAPGVATRGHEAVTADSWPHPAPAAAAQLTQAAPPAVSQAGDGASFAPPPPSAALQGVTASAAGPSDGRGRAPAPASLSSSASDPAAGPPLASAKAPAVVSGAPQAAGGAPPGAPQHADAGHAHH